MSRKNLYWTPEKIERLRENCNEPWSKLLRMFQGKTKKALKHVMGDNDIHRDRDEAPNRTKGLKKWTPEKIEELRQHRNDPWSELQKRFKVGINRLESVMSNNKITRNKPESVLWTEQADRILIEAAIQSHRYNTKTGEGRRQLRQLKDEIIDKLKKTGFKGRTSKSALSMHISNMGTERLKQLGFSDVSAPLGWGAPLEFFGRNIEQKDLQPTSKDWFKVLEEKNPPRYKEFLEKFLDHFRSDYRISDNTNADLLKEWPECPTEDGLRYGASFLGEQRSRLQIAADIDQVGKMIEKRIAELIPTGILSTMDTNGLLEKIKKEFVKELKSVTVNIQPDSFKTAVLEIIWDKNTLENLEKCLRLDILANFYLYNKHIPREIVDDKVKELRGRSTIAGPVAFKHGLGRILDETSKLEDEKFNLPASTFKQPVKIVTGKKSWKVSFPNAPNIGTVYDPVMRKNPLRRAFADAEHSNDDAVFLANIIDLDIRKASGSATKIYRSLFAGLNVNLNIIDPDYRKKAAEIIENSPDNAVLYETIAESFHGIMSGLSKIMNWNNKLQYSGKIYVVLTRKEQDVIAKAAYMEERYITICRIAELNVIKNMLTKEIARGQASQEDLDKIIKEIARTIISLVHSQEDRRFYKRVLAFMVRQIEKALGPNCQVIGMGNSHIEIDGLLGELHIPKSEAITDTHLKNYVSTFGAKSYLGRMPGFTVVLPSYPLCARNGEQERYVEGQRLMPTKIWVAPPLVDDKFLREALNNNAYIAHNLAKAVENYQFNPGLLRLEYVNGDINSHYLSMDSLAPKSRKDSRETYGGKFLCLMFGTDPHWGGRSKVYIEDKENRRSLGMAEASMEMMRRGGLLQPAKMRVHGFHMLDDGIQARNFDTQYEPSPNQMSNLEIEQYQAEIENKIQKSTDLQEIKKLSAEKDSLIRNQFNLRGSDYPKQQMDDVFKRHIEPNIDFFHALISQGEDAGIKYEGLSEITGARVDRRDIGAVTYPNGNHFAHTVWGAVTEGEFYAQKLQDKLKALDRWKKDPELIDKLIRAPIHSSEYFALGRIVLPGGYKYGVDFRGTPPRFASWADTLLGWVRNDIFTGDMEGHMSGRFTIGACGDKHFFASTYVSYKFYHMSASGSHTDQYGKKGFSPNNTGVSFVLLPVDGPENGPIITRTFSATYMADYFKKPFDIDWEAELPNPL